MLNTIMCHNYACIQICVFLMQAIRLQWLLARFHCNKNITKAPSIGHFKEGGPCSPPPPCWTLCQQKSWGIDALQIEIVGFNVFHVYSISLKPFVTGPTKIGHVGPIFIGLFSTAYFHGKYAVLFDLTYLTTEMQYLDSESSWINYQQTLKILWPYHIGIRSYESLNFEKGPNFKSPHALFSQAWSHFKP